MKTFYTQQKQFLAVVFLFLLTNLSFGQCFTKVAAGKDHTVAIASNGTLWAWGNNSLGQLGIGTAVTSTNVPIQIGTAQNWYQVSAGNGYTIALRNSSGLFANKQLWAWGKNNAGQLGDGTFIAKNTPVQIGTSQTWVDISAGFDHTLAIQDSGSQLVSGNRTLWAWGGNDHYQLSDNTTTNSNVPTNSSPSINWSKVAAGNGYSIARKTDGTLYGWGWNHIGQCGVNSTAVNITGRFQIGVDTEWSTNFSAGGGHVLATLNNGWLYAWGYNSNGQLGIGSDTNQIQPLYVNSGFDKIASGGSHSIALSTSGVIYTFGNSNYGQLGLGATLTANIPTITSASNWSKVISGQFHSLAINSDGTLWSWGRNDMGQLGDGANIYKDIPTLIACPGSLSTNEQIAENASLIVFPNPSSNGMFSIQSLNNILDVKAFDILGKQIDVEKNNNSYKINASTGIYTIKIIDDNGNSQIKKIILN